MIVSAATLLDFKTHSALVCELFDVVHLRILPPRPYNAVLVKKTYP